MRTELQDTLWQSNEFIDDNTLTVNINRLRGTLTHIGVSNDFLQTKRGMGYRIP
jgi:DNA-binding response OmpR family regulator